MVDSKMNFFLNKRWKKFKSDYLPEMTKGIIIFSALFFLTGTAKGALPWHIILCISVIGSTLLFLFLFGIGFWHEVIYKGNIQLRKLNQILKPHLEEVGFQIDDDNFIKGEYQGFMVHIYWFKSTDPKNPEEKTTVRIFIVPKHEFDFDLIVRIITSNELKGDYGIYCYGEENSYFEYNTVNEMKSEETRFTVDVLVNTLIDLYFMPRNALDL